VKGKGLYMPLRIAVTGAAHGPDLTSILVIRGRKDVIGSIGEAIRSISRQGG
jgi:glutamyl/glutaminyl-tRNA synthetase